MSELNNIAQFWTSNSLYAGSISYYVITQHYNFINSININAIGLMRNMKDNNHNANYLKLVIIKTGSTPEEIFNKNIYSITNTINNVDTEYIYDLGEQLFLESQDYMFMFCLSNESYLSDIKPTILFGAYADTAHFFQSENLIIPRSYQYGITAICTTTNGTYSSGTSGNAILINFYNNDNDNGNGNGELEPPDNNLPVKNKMGLPVKLGLLGLGVVILLALIRNYEEGEI